jgi:TetR/AcrR family transcriptional regulator of autoinduction and epiphytic fitness
LQAAKEAFLSHGFRNTSMDQVADLAQVSKRTVYNHFENKEALFRAVSVGLCSQAKALPIAYQPDAPLHTQLLEIALQEVKILTSDSYIAAFRALLVESFELPGIVKQIASELPDNDTLHDWITAATGDGRLHCDNTEQATLHLHTQINGAFFWPVLIGFGAAPRGKAKQQYLENTVGMFLSYYATTT